jgi:hypothetical protein
MPNHTTINRRTDGGNAPSLDSEIFARRNLSRACDKNTALSQAIGQIEGAKENAARAINTAIRMREYQLDIRIKYIAR